MLFHTKTLSDILDLFYIQYVCEFFIYLHLKERKCLYLLPHCLYNCLEHNIANIVTTVFVSLLSKDALKYVVNFNLSLQISFVVLLNYAWDSLRSTVHRSC
jgi:hypothetical protein